MNEHGGMIGWAKTHWIMLTVGVVGIYIIYEYLLAPSGAAASGSVGYTAQDLQNAYSQGSAAGSSNGQLQLATQQESDANAIAEGNLSLQAQQLSDELTTAQQQNQVAYAGTIGNNVLAFATGIGNIIQSQLALPAAAINAAAQLDETALASSAATAVGGFNALPGLISNSLEGIGIQTGNFGTTLIGFGNNLGQQGSNALNSIQQASNGAVSGATSSSNAASGAAASATNSANTVASNSTNSSLQSANASANSNAAQTNSTMGMVGTGALMLAMLL